jgi:hypothetical protein
MPGGSRGKGRLAGAVLQASVTVAGAGGIPARGNQRSEWDAGCRFDFENPDYR